MGCSSSSSAEVVNTATTIYPKIDNQNTADPKNGVSTHQLSQNKKYKLFYFDFTGKAEIIRFYLV